MAKGAAITIRLPEALKRRISARAKRERRSVSAQVLHDLELIAASEDQGLGREGHFLGKFSGTRLPTKEDLDEVRDQLWRRVGRGPSRHG